MFTHSFRIVFLLSMALFIQTGMADSADPMFDARTGYTDVIGEFAPVNTPIPPSTDTTPPEFTITHSEDGAEVTITVTSDEALFTGWAPASEIWSDTNWDFWWLNTRIAVDDDQNIYAAVRLWEYSNPNSNYAMFELDNSGSISGTSTNWNGPGGNPLIINYPSPNIYIGSPTLCREGAVDSANNITCIFYNNGGPNVLFTKIAADGAILVDGELIITGANAWANEIRTAIAPDGRIYIVWSDSMRHITISYSDDGGGSWSTPTRISCGVAPVQLNKPQIRCDSNGNVHIIWQHWAGGVNRLAYMKLNPDATVSIDRSFLTSSVNVWAPQMDIDEANNLSVVWASSSQHVTSAYFTKINGNLDGGGGSLSDDTLSIIQEEAFISSQPVRYSKCVVDAYWNLHVVYESGEYGRHKPKAMNHMKRNANPLLRIVCPNESVIFIEMTGAGAIWEGTFSPPEHGTYELLASGSDAAGNTGTGIYSFEFPGVGIEQGDISPGGALSLVGHPNPITSTLSISFNLPEAGPVHLAVFDMYGRMVTTLVDGDMSSGCHLVQWNASSVAPGIYFYRITAGPATRIKRAVVVR